MISFGEPINTSLPSQPAGRTDREIKTHTSGGEQPEPLKWGHVGSSLSLPNSVLLVAKWKVPEEAHRMDEQISGKKREERGGGKPASACPPLSSV